MQLKTFTYQGGVDMKMEQTTKINGNESVLYDFSIMNRGTIAINLITYLIIATVVAFVFVTVTMSLQYGKGLFHHSTGSYNNVWSVEETLAEAP